MKTGEIIHLTSDEMVALEILNKSRSIALSGLMELTKQVMVATDNLWEFIRAMHPEANDYELLLHFESAQVVVAGLKKK